VLLNCAGSIVPNQSVKERMRVVLAPRIDLHSGYHAIMLEDRQSDYFVASPDHVFVSRDEVVSPYSDQHHGEFLSFGSGDSGLIIQSARLPVIGSRSWLVDTDDLLAGPLCGRMFLDSEFQDNLKRLHSDDFLSFMKKRMRLMLSAYVHGSCAGIILRGDPDSSFDIARHWFSRLEVVELGEAYLEKVTAVKPARAPISWADFEAKWNDLDERRVVFCGRDFETKNGALALEVMSHLMSEMEGLSFTYIGDIPDDFKNRSPHLVSRITHLPSVGRSEVIREMQRSHVFFHPSKFETVGLSLIEAASCGMAVVSCSGVGLEFSKAIFHDGGALLIDRTEADAHENPKFLAALESLLKQPDMMRSMGLANVLRSSRGDNSFDAQMEKIVGVRKIAASYRGDPFTIDHLGGLKATVISSSRLFELEDLKIKSRSGESIRVVI